MKDMINRVLRYGSIGKDVEELQKKLNLVIQNVTKVNLLIGKPMVFPRSKGNLLNVDGVYGQKTTATILDFQSVLKLVVDGITGNQTWGKLEELITSLSGQPPIISTPPSIDPKALVRELIVKKADLHVGTISISPNFTDEINRDNVAKIIAFFNRATPSTQITAEDFKDNNRIWGSRPYLRGRGKDAQPIDWCGIFCVSCCIEAGCNHISWQNGIGIIGVSPFKGTLTDVAQNVLRGDIGYINSSTDPNGKRHFRRHYFIVTGKDFFGTPNFSPYLSSIDGNQATNNAVQRFSFREKQPTVKVNGEFTFYPVIR
jgi:peptidoglycan hydrolase-like protein with peptidoglycan-binding domain